MPKYMPSTNAERRAAKDGATMLHVSKEYVNVKGRIAVLPGKTLNLGRNAAKRAARAAR